MCLFVFKEKRTYETNDKGIFANVRYDRVEITTYGNILNIIHLVAWLHVMEPHTRSLMLLRSS